MSAPRVLVLGGTGEARAIAAAAASRGCDVLLSLAGRTRVPAEAAVPTRSGGFGGADGLAAFLRAGGFAACIDATHPFAIRISANAVAACEAAGVKRLVHVRPEWSPVDGDRWTYVADVAQAARLLPAMARRVFVAFADGIEPLAGLDIAFVVRRAEPGPVNLPGARVLVQRGPFARDAERALFAAERIDAVLAKASGGTASRAKLDAARNLGLPVVLLRRPPPPPGSTAAGVAETVIWLAGALGLDPDRPGSV